LVDDLGLDSFAMLELWATVGELGGQPREADLLVWRLGRYKAARTAAVVPLAVAASMAVAQSARADTWGPFLGEGVNIRTAPNVHATIRGRGYTSQYFCTYASSIPGTDHSGISWDYGYDINTLVGGVRRFSVYSPAIQ
jgi:hypothetical protein